MLPLSEKDWLQAIYTGLSDTEVLEKAAVSLTSSLSIGTTTYTHAIRGVGEDHFKRWAGSVILGEIPSNGLSEALDELATLVNFYKVQAQFESKPKPGSVSFVSIPKDRLASSKAGSFSLEE